MRQIGQAVEVRIDRFTAPGKVNQRRLVAAVALLALESGDATADRLGTVRRTALHDLGVEGRKFAGIEANGYLRRQVRSGPPA